jgi:hypothetical protein
MQSGDWMATLVYSSGTRLGQRYSHAVTKEPQHVLLRESFGISPHLKPLSVVIRGNDLSYVESGETRRIIVRKCSARLTAEVASSQSF